MLLREMAREKLNFGARRQNLAALDRNFDPCYHLIQRFARSGKNVIELERMRRLRAYFERHGRLRRAVIALCILGVLAAQYLQLQLSTVQNIYILAVRPVNVLVNLAIVALPTLLLGLFFRRLTVPLIITSAIYTLWSVANVYVITYHGSPLFLNELLHARDAAEVISGYSFKIHTGILALLVFDICEVVGILALRLLGYEGVASRPGRAALRLGAAVVCAAFAMLCLFGPAPTKPRVALTSSYRKAVRNYGFMTCLVEDVDKMLHPCTLPEGYSPEALPSAAGAESTPLPEALPDIVLILNETFYDLSVYTDLEADSDYLSPLYDLPGAALGHCLSPKIGGGTNDSEYELLTSNSTYLLNSSAPFNYMNMEAPGNSLARYLEGFGYESWGMHCGSPKGYSRGIGYPQLGFDHVLLGPDMFVRHSAYGNRDWLDWDNYQDLIDQYEAGGEGPRFLYLLTYQNHGGYEQNDAELDTVHSRTDFGELTDDVDEYITSVSMSAEAFRQLADYFAESERPVIVCMVGDHAPSFINELPARSKTGLEAEAERNKRRVPYVLWSNFGAELPDAGQAAMVDLGPMVLEAAGLPLSPYYRAVLDARAADPVRLPDGEFVDAAGNAGSFDPGDAAQEALKRYYYMEYNSLAGGEDYRPELFRAAVE